MLSQEPLVSICIPTYNRAGKLRQAVSIALAGKYRNIEVIISDNGSSDDTSMVGEEFAARDSRVRYFRHSKNMGPTKNFEFARQQAKGEYFLWHSDDDYLSPEYIPSCVAALESNASLVLASGLAAYHRGDRIITHLGNIMHLESASSLIRVTRYLFQVQDNSIFYGIYRKTAVKSAQLPNCLGGDRIWMCETLLHGKARVLSDVHLYREWGDSMSASYERMAAIVNAPSWHARFRFLAIALNTLKVLGEYLALLRKPLLTRIVYQLVIIASLTFRSARFHGKEFVLTIPWIGAYIGKKLRPY